MSKYVEIKNNTPIEDIIEMVTANPAGGIFRFANRNARANFLFSLNTTKGPTWLRKNRFNTSDPRKKLNFEPKDSCSLIITRKVD